MTHVVYTGASEPDFNLFGDTACAPPAEAPAPRLPNASSMGVVTLAPDGTFISARALDQDELALAWAEHYERHGRP